MGVAIFLLCFCFWADFSNAAEKSWPNKPITVYVGWTAGGSSDTTTRALVLEMEKRLGRRILVSNIAGANGSIGASQVARGSADGHLWFGGAAVHGTWPILGHSDVSWTHFYAFLSVVCPTTIYVRKDAPWISVQELLADIESSPQGRFKYGHPGVGSNGQIFVGLLLRAAGTPEKARSIPYKGGREAGRYLLSGETDFASVTMGDLSDWAVAGRVRPLANLLSSDLTFAGVEFPAIVSLYPQLKPYEAINPYYGIYVSRETPPEIVTTIAETFEYAIQQTGFQDIAVKERAGILAPKLGRASDELMSKIESSRGWALFQLGVTPKSPAELGVPKLDRWSWPPHDRAAKLRPWPQAVETLYKKLSALAEVAPK